MRALVIQLARFGDIYQTWPTLKALVRGGDEVHVLTRERFKDALVGLEDVTPHIWPTAEILSPVIEDGNEADALARLDAHVAKLKGFDRVINLTFSPFSSFLTDALAAPKTRGYTRTTDGYLAIPDDASAYFYAQAQGPNRYHLTEIFAAVAGVELKPEDYRGIQGPSPRERRVIVHLGASRPERVYPGELWAQALARAIQGSAAEFILVGSPDEKPLADAVLAKVPRLVNKVGQTTLPELMRLIASSSLVIGADSAPSQMASLTQTPVLHLTCDVANFWATGPTSPGSRILHADVIHNISPERIGDEAHAMLNGLEPKGPCAQRTSVLGSYATHGLQLDDFGWKLIQALYVDGDYPQTERPADLIAMQRLFELSELALTFLDKLDATAATQLASADMLIRETGVLCPRIDPLVQWFETQRLRIPPGAPEETLASTRQIYADLHVISSVYRRFGDVATESGKASALCRLVAPALREFELKGVQGEFHSLVSTLQELSRHSTKVGETTWSQALSGLNEALERRDFVEAADQLEYVLAPRLS